MPTTLDPGKKGVGIDLVDGNLAVRSQLLNWGTVSWAFATAAIPAGAKQYVEFKADNIGTRNLMIGFGDATDLSGPLTVGVSYRNDRAYWVDNVYTGDLAAWLTSNVVMMAIDGAAGKVWFGVNGAWSGNPAAGTGGISHSIAGLFIGCGAYVHATEGPHKITARFAASTQTYAPPAGFTAVDNDAGGAGVTGALAAAEGGADTAAIFGEVRVSGQLGAGEPGADAALMSGAVTVQGALAAAESGADTASFTGVVPVAGTLTAAEAGSDTCAMAGTIAARGALAARESGMDAADLSGRAIVSGTLDAVESGGDTAWFSSSKQATITGTLAASESSDSAAIAGTVRANGALVAAESGRDSVAFAGLVAIGGRLAAQEPANDNVAMIGRILVSGSLVAVESSGDTAWMGRRDDFADISGTGRWLSAQAESRTLIARAESRILRAR